MNSDQIRELESKLVELSREELLELIKSTFQTNEKARTVGLSQLEATREVCLNFLRQNHYEPDPKRLNRDIEIILNKVKRILNAHKEYFVRGVGKMLKEDGVPMETTVWKLRQPEPELNQEPQREEQREEKAREQEEQQRQRFKFPFRRAEYPELAELLEELPATLSEKAAHELKQNVDLMLRIKRTPLNLESWSYVRKELLVRKMAFALINSKIANHSESGSEGQANNNSRIRQYTNKLVSLLKS
jgi:hypothetical protein